MVDDSINMANDVERHYAVTESRDETTKKCFIAAAQLGVMSANSPINYGFPAHTVEDMLYWSLSNGTGVTLGKIFAYLAKMSKEDDEAMSMLETMADQFIWRTT
jgi:hypothetical protein